MHRKFLVKNLGANVILLHVVNIFQFAAKSVTKVGELEYVWDCVWEIELSSQKELLDKSFIFKFLPKVFFDHF